MDRTAILTLAIIAGCVAAPYLLGVSPRNRRQWLYVALTLAFVMWILPMVAHVR